MDEKVGGHEGEERLLQAAPNKEDQREEANCVLKTMSAAKEISADATVAVILSVLAGIFTE